MDEPSREPGIENEPHLRQAPLQADPGEADAERILRHEAAADRGEDVVEHSVWDEPALVADLAGAAPEGALTYANWLAEQRARTSVAFSWFVVLGVALCAGPWAVFGALFGGTASASSVLMVVLFGPVTEEVMKIAIPLWVVEKRPYWFRWQGQIGVCALCSGFVFAALENALYLNVYIDNPSSMLIAWRWTVCVALHMGCSLIASQGLVRIWRQTMHEGVKPRIEGAFAMIALAILLHGFYNGSMVVLEKSVLKF